MNKMKDVDLTLDELLYDDEHKLRRGDTDPSFGSGITINPFGSSYKEWPLDTLDDIFENKFLDARLGVLSDYSVDDHYGPYMSNKYDYTCECCGIDLNAINRVGYLCEDCNIRFDEKNEEFNFDEAADTEININNLRISVGNMV